MYMPSDRIQNMYNILIWIKKRNFKIEEIRLRGEANRITKIIDSNIH